MNKKWYKDKLLIILIACVSICMILGVVLLSIYGVPDLWETIYSRSFFVKYSPDIIKKPIFNLADKQRNTKWRSYRSNIHVKNFFMLYRGGFSVSGGFDNDKEGTLQCWGIIYKRYYLTMNVDFKENFLKTGIASYSDPVFELVELKSITNIGRPGGWSPHGNAIHLSDSRGGDLEIVPVGEKMKFGRITWDTLLEKHGDLKVIFPDALKDKPLQIIYDFTKTEESAEKGDSYAQKFLVLAYHRGGKIPKDYKKAMKWCKKLAANQEIYHHSRWAAYCAGYMYFYGQGVEKDAFTAFKWYLKSAAKGYPRAYFQLGMMCDNGVGVKKSSEKAEKWFKKGADVKEIHSCNCLAYMWAERGQNLPEAEKLINTALAKRPDSSYFIDTLGWIYYKQGKYKEAVKQLKKSVELRPNTLVLDHLGDAYAKLEKHDKAVKCWKEAVEIATENDAEVKEKILLKLK